MQYGLGGAELIGGALLSLLGPSAVAGIPMMMSGAQTLSGSTTGSGSGGGTMGSGLMSMLPLAGLFGGGGSKSAPAFAPPPQLAQAAPTQPLSLGVPQTQQQTQGALPPITQAALQPPQNRLPMGANQMSPDDQLTAFLAARGIPT